MPLAALLLLAATARADEPSTCRDLAPIARRLEVSPLRPSLLSPLSCGIGGGEPSDYAQATD
ncbi:MAG TPA: hypothetical protein VNI01_08200, partial [Elusimicrobiota bacterium]|nr:hypothetical protein [Elusimicrobiota bacterium]